jgi:tetratricopeptide (TPR) repeat protein
MADDQAQPERRDELGTAIAAVKQNPKDRARWEHVEELLESTQRTDDVSALFRALIGGALPKDTLADVGQRGLRFYETWYGEDSAELGEWLQSVLAIDPHAQWAFERLTVAYTSKERWTDLLDAYDRAIGAADQTARRMRLLEEAAQIAKDFAGEPDRAIGYMLKSYALDPDNAALASGLERLLERQQRWEDLVGLWQSRLAVQPQKQARDARVRVASCYLDKLGRHAEALEQAKIVLADAPDHDAAYDVLERVLEADGARAETRREALQLLRHRLIETRKPREVVRVLEAGLRYAEGGERRALLRELCERLIELGDDDNAMKFQAQLLALEPIARETDALRALAERTRNYELFAAALVDAAARCEDAMTAAELLLEAARTAQNVLGDDARASALYQRVFDSEAPGERVVEAGRKLVPLLEKAGREAETLQALGRLSELERDVPTRRALLGRMAKLAEKLGDAGRAEQAWQARLREDAEDLEALEALIASAAEQQQWVRLATLLERRITAAGASSRRRQDMVWLASTYADRLDDADAAIEVWRRIASAFGEDTESVAALTDLLGRAERWNELAEVLNQAAARQIARFTELQTRLGDAYRERLDQPELAAERYASALQVDPRDEAALRGQQALIHDERCRVRAVTSLADAYERTGDFRHLLELLEPRLSIAATPAAQAERLIHAAALYEDRAGDARAALSCLRRAFALSPDDRTTEKGIRRLAERLSAWDAVVAAYRDTIARLPERTPRVAELRLYEGQVHEESLDDPASALAAYAEAASIAPERVELAAAATRVAVALERWDEAAARVVACFAARRAIVAELLAQLEAAAGGARAWQALSDAMTAALIAQADLEKPLARQLHARVASWHKSQRKDENAAEAALARAVAADGSDVATLRALADLQRRAPSERLVETLLAIAELEPHDLDALLEAADLAREHVGERLKRLTIWQRLYDRAADMLRGHTEARGGASAAHSARFALDQLVATMREAGAQERALTLLLGASALPFDEELRREDLHRAAQIARVELGDAVRATGLYRDLLQSDATDRQALRELASLYRESAQLPELLALKRGELAVERDPEQALALRLEIAGLLGELEARGGRAQTLLDNLRHRPGHAATLDALRELLAAQGKHGELAELLHKQGELLAQGEPERAAQLVQQAALIYERELAQAERAIDTYRALYELDPTGEATAALARLYTARGDHAQAAKWLELRLGTVPPDTRAVTGVELAQALLEAGDAKRARACLEQALAENPGLRSARDLLGAIYREQAAWEPLAALLIAAAAHEGDAGKQLALLREGAAIYCDTLHAPARAIGALERACALSPNDRALAVKLADAFTAERRFAEARAVFERLIEAFGRKRSSERAELHYRLARVQKAAGETARAEEELETATKMDLGHVPALRMLAELSEEQGDLDRAERTYRSLLMLVRRKKQDELDAIGPSEIFFALSTIASARDQASQAGELLESAMEAATQSDAEARRFSALLRERGRVELLMRLLDAREKLVQDDAARAELLDAKADVLAGPLGKPEEALAARLTAIELQPDDDALHARARALSVASSALDRYLERVGALADEAGRKKDDAAQRRAARLLLRMGEAIEQELSDFDRAAGLYARVESSGHHVALAFMATARVAGARGDVGEQRRVLQHITELGAEQVSAEEKRTARFALVQLELAHENLRDAGVASLERALADSGYDAQAKALLRAAIAAAPSHLRLSALFAEVARASNDSGMLLEHLERRAKTPDVSFEELREGVELAMRLLEPARAEALLKRALQLVAKDEPAKKSWVHARLSDCRKRAGDVAGAIEQLEAAVEGAAEDDVEPLTRALAELAAGPGGDLEVAAAAYAKLHEADAGDPSLWRPLLDVYVRLGDRKRLDQFATQCARDLSSPGDRAFVLLAQAKFLIDAARDERSAIPVLKALLEDSPGHAEATDLLTRTFQKLGMNEQLAELLHVHFDRARDERNLTAIAELGLRIGELYGERNPEAALDTYRSALQWIPDHRGLLQALLLRLGPEADLRERADVMQALLKTETGDEAARLSLQLAPMWLELHAADLAQSALELGLAAAPDASGVRDRLEAFYAEREMWRELAQLLEREAARAGSTPESVGRLMNAASLYRDQLKDLDCAANALRKALDIVPEDLSLLGELARNLAAAGQQRAAIDDVTRLLGGHPQADAGRADLLKVRAELSLELADLGSAVADLEEAYAITPETMRHRLLDAVERQKTAAFTAGNAADERGAVMRLCELHEAGGDRDAAREVLSDWVEQAPEDYDALRALLRRDEAAERWDDVARSCERLLHLETGPARVTTAIALADACTEAGRPADALAPLERLYAEDRQSAMLRARLRELYEALDRHAELAAILLDDARLAADTGERVEYLQRSARLYLMIGDAGAALVPLTEASKLQPDDLQNQLLMIDTAVQLGRVDEAQKALDAAIAVHKRKRSPELAALYQRMARLSAARGDTDEQLKWLNQAVEIDRKSGELASELAEASIAVANYDVAMKALRALTMMDDPRPITRAMAFLKQAQIAHMRGDPRRAQHWARKAKSLDDGLVEVDTFLAEIGG